VENVEGDEEADRGREEEEGEKGERVKSSTVSELEGGR
jgi:hypothetical protein